jgi:hypothetical protein
MTHDWNKNRNEAGRVNTIQKKSDEVGTATSWDWGTAELLCRLHNGTRRGEGGETNQSARGRMGLGTACRKDAARMKNVSIGRKLWRKKIYVFGMKNPVRSHNSWFK